MMVVKLKNIYKCMHKLSYIMLSCFALTKCKQLLVVTFKSSKQFASSKLRIFFECEDTEDVSMKYCRASSLLFKNYSQ